LEPEDLFYLAQLLAGKPPTKPVPEEVKLRSAIIRAYYASFHKARNFINEYTALKVPTDPTGHEFIRNIFRGSADGKWKKVAYALDRLIDKRTKADYGDPMPGLNNDVDFVLLQAQNAINLINELIQIEKSKKRN
jgi:uncharacterized protein (UPF0332 family)